MNVNEIKIFSIKKYWIIVNVQYVFYNNKVCIILKMVEYFI